MITSSITVTPAAPAIPSGSVLPNGLPGPSAYQIAVSQGYPGTPAQWLASLSGPAGASAYALWLEAGNTGTLGDFLASLVGPAATSAQVAAAVAALAVGTAPGTIAAGNDPRIVGALQGAGGDASATTARPAGAPLARSLAAILADFPSAGAFGAAGDGSDQTAAIKAAIAALTSGGLLRFAAGHLVTDGSVPNTEVGYEFDAPTITGGYIPGIMDQAAACRALKVLAGVLGPRFDHLLHVSGISEPTGVAASNERTLIYVHGQQNEPSDYTVDPPYLRDLALVEFSATIPAGNMAGRIWGTNHTLIVEAGADGYAVVAEAGIVNNGAYQPTYGTHDAKLGIHMLASGPQDATAAYVVGSSGGRWRFGLYSYPEAIRPDGYLWMLDTGVPGLYLAFCDPSGHLKADTLEVTHGKATLGSGQPGLQAGKVVLRGTSTGGNPVRLTMDGNPASPSNVPIIPDYSVWAVSVQAVARDASSGSSHIATTLPIGLLKRVTGPGSTTWFAGSPVTINDGGPNTSGATFSFAADTTLGSISVIFAPPNGNADQWDVIATLATTEGQ